MSVFSCLLGGQFVQAQAEPIEKLNSQDMLDFMIGLAKIDR